MPELAIIGGQEIDVKEWVNDPTTVHIPTSNGALTAVVGKLQDGPEILFLTRNAQGYPIPSHAIDYKTNIEALVNAGIRRVITTANVGSLRLSVPVGSLVLLDQFLDFTKNRQFNFFSNDRFGFADMTEPFCPVLRGQILQSAERAKVTLSPSACYVCVDGPRFETRAEVQMFAQLGGDVIGMTGVTECVMAREVGLCFATVAGVVNLGAGLADSPLNAELWHPGRRLLADQLRRTVVELSRLPANNESDLKTGCICAKSAPIQSG